MENTYVPLDIIFADKEGKIVSIGHGSPMSLDSVPARGAASLAVEVPDGWCLRHNVTVGDRFSFSLKPEAEEAKGFVADNMLPNFGASAEEVAVAVRDGTFKLDM